MSDLNIKYSDNNLMPARSPQEQPSFYNTPGNDFMDSPDHSQNSFTDGSDSQKNSPPLEIPITMQDQEVQKKIDRLTSRIAIY